MCRISSVFFLLSLIFYYVPKALKLKKFKFVKVHIFLGSISVIAMCSALIEKIGQQDFLKYIGFSIVMLLIGISGYLTIKNRKKFRKLHIMSMLSFFIYLVTIIVL